MAIDVELFYDAINNIARRQVEANPGDLTIDAQISVIYNADIGEYKVEYQGNVFSAYSTDPTITYSPGERVYVLVPKGDFSSKKMIISRASYDNLTYQQKQDMTNFYIEQGPNWVSGEEGTYRMEEGPLQICAVPVGSKKDLDIDTANYEDQGFRRWTPEEEKEEREYGTRYPIGYMTQEELDQVDELFRNFSTSYNSIKIQGSFMTKFLNAHDQGEYYLEVIFITKNPRYIAEGEPRASTAKDEPEYILVPYKLEFYNFNGSPYEYPVYTPQKAYFDISSGGLAGIYRISLMQDGNFISDIVPSYNADGELQLNPNDAVLDQNNILCKDIEIRFCQKVNLLDNLYYCWIEQPYGDAVYDKVEGAYGRDSVYLVPHFLYSSQEVTKNCVIRWFREDLSVSNETPILEGWETDDFKHYWTYYTGPGWRPIEHFIQDRDQGQGAPEEGESGDKPAWSNEYEVSSEGILKVTKDAVVWKWRYKLVCVYEVNGTFGSAIAEVIRKDTKYDLYIDPYTSKDNRKSFLRINDNNHKVGEQINPATGDFYPEWFGTWYAQLPDNAYLQKSIPYHHAGFDITDFGNYESVTFRVACYDPMQVCPPDGEYDENNTTNMTQAEEIGYLEYQAIQASDVEVLISWEGEPKSFNYTAAGLLYADQDSSVDHTLAVKLNQVFGSLTAWGIAIKAPDGTLLGDTSDYNNQVIVDDDGNEIEVQSAGTKGYCPSCSMMYDMYHNGFGVFHFKVRQEYDAMRSLNTVTAIITNKMSGVQYEAPCVITFTKDGQQGTQGTNWCAPIYPTNHNTYRKKTVKDGVVTVDQDMAPFTTQLSMQTCPLIIKRVMNGGKESFEQDVDQNRIFLRPFVTKDGKAIESITESGGDSRDYRYKVYWDVRFPQSFFDSRLKGASFLRLCDVDSGLPLTDTGNHAKGDYNPKDAVGLTCMTEWDGDLEDGKSSTYGAVEIRYEPGAGLNISHEETRFNFVVKATIDIETKLPSDAIKRKTENGKVTDYVPAYKEQGTWHRIKTLVAWYPIDVFIYQSTDNSIPFSLNNLYINWPKEIPYTSTGYSPQIIDQFLEFYYDFDPVTQDKSEGYQVIPDDGITRNIQTVVSNVRSPVEMDEVSQHLTMTKEQQSSYVDTLPPENYRYKLKPKTHLNWQEGSVGTLAGRLPENKDRNIPGGTFYRNQVYYANKYGNVDINGWDGQGIDINEEDGTIFAPTIGAGFKGPLTNTFTGVLMGVNSEFKRQTDGVVQYTDIEAEELEDYPLMTGLFGYQCGVASFGLLENGTAFFGRADRGGRIIIDGYNATIYGGANGVLSSPAIGDPMWNSMRLSLVDLTHQCSGLTTDGYGDIKIEDDIDIDPNDNTTTDPDKNTAENPPKPVTTSVQGIMQGYGGESFGGTLGSQNDKYGLCRELPVWYKYIWEHAYIKGKNTLPWWYGWNKKDPKELDEYDPKIHGSYDNSMPNYAINYWQPSLDQIIQYAGIPDNEKGPISGFGPSRASTTPAIEIGQHPPGLMPGLLPWGSQETVFKNMYIPGNRNFMVTYDGTLWAMNGVFMGNVIGSNIVGGRIQGVEVGIGDPDDIDFSKIRKIQEQDKWAMLKPPTARALNQDEIDELVGTTTINSHGKMIVSEIIIYGGQIDMGSFHIIGNDVLSPGGDSAYGNLIQFGHSDFVGPTHFYGNVGIGPDEGDEKNKNSSNEGNLFQTNGLAALGIIYETQQFVWHKYFAKDDGSMQDVTNYYRKDGSFKPGDPGILTMSEEDGSMQQAAMFVVNTRTKEAINRTDEGYCGHFWPLSFRYTNTNIAEGKAEKGKDPTIDGVHAYVTLMDIFKSRPFTISAGVGTGGGDQSLPEGELEVDGGNYFRIGPWGYEFVRGYICQGWQNENKSQEPTVDREVDRDNSSSEAKVFPGGVRGVVGLVNRAGGGNAQSQAIGMTSWGKAPIIMSSDENFVLKTKNWMSLRALAANPDMAKAYDANKNGLGGEFSDPGYYGYSSEIGIGQVLNPDGNGRFTPKLYAYVVQVDGFNKGFVSLGLITSPGANPNGATIPYPFTSNSQAGLFLLPEQNEGLATPPGNYLYSNKSDIHIVRSPDDQPKNCQIIGNEVTEVLLKEDQITLYAKTRIVIGWGGGQCAHTLDTDWKHAAFFQGEGIQIINNDSEEDIGEPGTGGGSGTEPEPAVPGEKKYCIYFGDVDNAKSNSEITWQPNFISVFGNQVWIGAGDSSAHSPKNFMLFAQNSVDMKGDYAVPENQFHIYARFA